MTMCWELKGQRCGEYRLDIGCGRTCPDEYIGIDLVQIIDGKGNERVDIVRDIEKTGLPFCDNSAIEIRGASFFEHISDLVFVFNECWRVLKPGGKLVGNVPLANTDGALRDPTHKRVFVKNTFGYFTGVNPGLPDQPSHPKYANYGFLPWNLVSLEGEGSLDFVMTPRK